MVLRNRQATSPPSTPHMFPSDRHMSGLTETTTGPPNPDGSANVYVHHMQHGAPPQASPPPMMMPHPVMGGGGMPFPMPMPMTQPMPMPMPYPMSMPMPMPMPMPYPMPPPMYPPCCPPTQYACTPPQCACPPPQCACPPPQSSCPPPCSATPSPAAQSALPVVASQSTPKPEIFEDQEEDKAEDQPDGGGGGSQNFSKFSIVSIVIFTLALVFGIACVMKAYEAFDGRAVGFFRLVEQVETDAATDAAQRDEDRAVALGTGCASLSMFTIATLCSFYAGMRHRSKAKGEHSCQAGFLIASWIVFALTFVNAVIILVLAFNKKTVIYPELVWTAMVGSVVAWMLMFGHSEMARRT